MEDGKPPEKSSSSFEDANVKREDVSPAAAAAATSQRASTAASAAPAARKEDPMVGESNKKRHHDGNDHDHHKSSRKKSKRVKRKNMDPEILKLRATIQKCCATDDLATAVDAYDKAVAAGTRIEPQSFYNLLNLCEGLADRGIHVGSPKTRQQQQQNPKKEADAEATSKRETQECSGGRDDSQSKKPPQSDQSDELDLSTRNRHADRIKKRMDELQIPLTESCYTALIRLVSKSDVEEAEKLLDEAERVQQCRPRLRMYTPLIQAFSESGHMAKALKVWFRASKQGFVLTEKEYAALLQGACKAGDAAIMERVLSDLAEDVPVPSRRTCQLIVEWFQSPASIAHTTTSATTGEEEDGNGNFEIVKDLLLQIKVPYPMEVTHDSNMGPVQTDHANGWCIDDGCGVDSTGVIKSGCLKGACLKPVTTSQQAWDQMMHMNEQIVVSGRAEGDTSEVQGGRKGNKRQVSPQELEQRRRNWGSFQRYLARRKKLDVVIDGANVGYFEANFSGAPKHVDYSKIDWIVQHFLERKQSVLLVLHSRHFSRNMMPPQLQHFEKSWRKSGVLYSTPGGMNDDWFWLHAALVSGPGTLVLTNDEMRDHHFQMSAPRSFLRWKDRHQIHFEFGPWEDARNSREGRRKVILTYPDAYSRRIQRVEDGLVVPLPKRGDENRFLDGAHTADQEETPEEETYLCIRPKRC